MSLSTGPLDRLSVAALIALVILALTPWVVAAYGFHQLVSA